MQVPKGLQALAQHLARVVEPQRAPRIEERLQIRPLTPFEYNVAAGFNLNHFKGAQNARMVERFHNIKLSRNCGHSKVAALGREGIYVNSLHGNDSARFRLEVKGATHDSISTCTNLLAQHVPA